jgi:hypothetical protein
MMLDPNDYPLKNAGRDVPLQCCLTASASNVPCGVTSHEAAGNGHRRKQPGISVVSDQPKQEQVSATGQGQRNNGGIDDGNGKEPKSAQVCEPVRHERVLCPQHRRLSRLWDKDGHDSSCISAMQCKQVVAAQVKHAPNWILRERPEHSIDRPQLSCLEFDRIAVGTVQVSMH